MPASLHTTWPPTHPWEGLHPWETQACAFSGSWFPGSPGWRGMGEEALEGGGVGEAEPGTGRGRVWVGLYPACLPLSSSCQSSRPGWRTGGRGLAQENSCLSE